MATAPILCDYCRTAINLFSDEALLVAIHRRVDHDEWSSKPSELLSGDEVVLRFCSQTHLAEYAARVRIPAPTGGSGDGALVGWFLVACVLGLAILGLAGFGVYSLLRV